MKLPIDVLASLRGPLLGVAIAGCATAPAAAPITQEPAPEPAGGAAAAQVVDPVAYDADAEAARLASADEARIDHDARRDRRIADVEADRRRRSLARRPAPADPVVPVHPWMWNDVHAACGRG